MQRQRDSSGEEGFLLISVLVAIFIMLLMLSIAAPTIARQMRREREEQAVEDGRQYVRAIRVYYRKFGHYPTSIEQLEKTNNIRFLRKHYVDPLTGKDDWRMIHVGENKTQVKGFFGQPLQGLPGQSNLGGGGLSGSSPAGGSAGSSSSGPAGGGFPALGAALFGAGGGATNNGNSGATGAVGGTGTGTGTNGANGTGGTGTDGSSTSNNGLGGMTSTMPGGAGGGPIMGVGLNHPGDAMVSVNDQTTYDTWEFLYDPRSEPKQAPQSGMGGGTPGSGLQSTSSSNMNGTSGAQNGTGTGTGSGGTNGPGTPGTGGTSNGPGSNSPF